MQSNKVIHPNFRIGPGQKDIANRIRAIMVYLPQSAFDAIQMEMKNRPHDNTGEVIARAIEHYLNLPAGSASPSDST